MDSVPDTRRPAQVTILLRHAAVAPPGSPASINYRTKPIQIIAPGVYVGGETGGTVLTGKQAEERLSRSALRIEADASLSQAVTSYSGTTL